ncbi:thioredoxin-like protein [Phyllosticta citricarpa]|uniref:Thioredoxin-like protein n=1 Tax=Phyllosticta paracitricarpa TaxID=2016321 RepID=A0ABR1N3Y9_9PEZI
MALAPKFAGQKVAGSGIKTVHTLELYLDYVCPFSKKMFNTVYEHVLPTVKTRYASSLQIIFRQQIQPWHPSSTLVHEAGAAVLRLAPDRFYDFSKALFEQQTAFFDVSVVNETRNATYKRLAKIAGSVGVDETDVYGLLEIPDKAEGDALNVGNKVTDDVKVMVKTNRLVGIHVTPTVVFNGVVENSISSSFTGEQWDEWLKKNVV